MRTLALAVALAAVLTLPAIAGPVKLGLWSETRAACLKARHGPLDVGGLTAAISATRLVRYEVICKIGAVVRKGKRTELPLQCKNIEGQKWHERMRVISSKQVRMFSDLERPWTIKFCK